MTLDREVEVLYGKVVLPVVAQALVAGDIFRARNRRISVPEICASMKVIVT